MGEITFIERLKAENDELKAKIEAQKSKYDTAVTRKACLFVGIVCLIVGLVAGYFIGQYFTKPVLVKSAPIVETKYQTRTETKFVYVPKEDGEKTDLEANIGKQELNIKVNGQDAVIKKDDDERYIFDKNKVVIDQTSKATIDIKVPTIDRTKRFGIGAGFGNNGVGYMVKFPAGKFDGWGYKDKDTTAAGIMIGF